MIAGARRFIDAPSQGDRHKAFSPFPYEWESQHLDHPRGTPRARDLDEPADGLLLSQDHDQRERAVRKYTAMLAADQKEARSFLHPHLSSLVKGTTPGTFRPPRCRRRGCSSYPPGKARLPGNWRTGAVGQLRSAWACDHDQSPVRWPHCCSGWNHRLTCLQRRMLCEYCLSRPPRSSG